MLLVLMEFLDEILERLSLSHIEIRNTDTTEEKKLSDLDVALWLLLERQIHEHETLRLTKTQLLELIEIAKKHEL